MGVMSSGRSVAGEVDQGGCFDAIRAQCFRPAQIGEVYQELCLRDDSTGLVEEADGVPVASLLAFPGH